jgi:hypothetical protein
MPTFRMPPKSTWYVHLFKDQDTKLVHGAITTRRQYKRRQRSRAVCAILLADMWPRPSGDSLTCPKCVAAYDALDLLLRDEED